MTCKFLFNRKFPIKINIWIIFTIESRHSKFNFRTRVVLISNIIPVWTSCHTLTVETQLLMSTVIMVVDRLVVLGVTGIIRVVIPIFVVDTGRNALVLVYGGGISGSSWVLWMPHGHTPSSRSSGATRGVARINIVVDGGCSPQLVKT